MSEETKPKRKRAPGGGRKSLPPSKHMVYMQITLSPALRDFAKQQPGGASAYIRRLIEADQYLTKLDEFPEIA